VPRKKSLPLKIICHILVFFVINQFWTTRKIISLLKCHFILLMKNKMFFNLIKCNQDEANKVVNEWSMIIVKHGFSPIMVLVLGF